MMTSPVDVVVVAYGAPGLLDACLGALGGEFPVLVVDNSSLEKIRELSERHGATYVDPGHEPRVRRRGQPGPGPTRPPGRRRTAAEPRCPDLRPGRGRAAAVPARHLRNLACVAPAQVDGPKGRRPGWGGRSRPRSVPGSRRWGSEGSGGRPTS